MRFLAVYMPRTNSIDENRIVRKGVEAVVAMTKTSAHVMTYEQIILGVEQHVGRRLHTSEKDYVHILLTRLTVEDLDNTVTCSGVPTGFIQKKRGE